MMKWLKQLHAQRIEWVLTVTGVTLLLFAVGFAAMLIGMAFGRGVVGQVFVMIAGVFAGGALLDMFATTIHDAYFRKRE